MTNTQDYLISLLNKRKLELETILSKTPEWNEYQTINNTLRTYTSGSAIQTEPKLVFQSPNSNLPGAYHPKGNRIVDVKAAKVFRPRDSNNSPLRLTKWGERLRTAYEWATLAVEENGGYATIEQIDEYLAKNGIFWPKNENKSLAGYLNHFNKAFPDESKIILGPIAQPGKTRPFKYEFARLVTVPKHRTGEV